MMKKTQIFLIAGAILLFVALSFMPKVVVDNEGGQVGELDAEAAATSTAETKEEHVKLPPLAVQRLDSLQNALKVAQSESEERLVTANIVDVFVENNRIDSAASFAWRFAKKYPSWETRKIAGDLYYDAFTYAVSDEKAKEMGKEAEKIYTKLLEEEPDSLNLQVKIGMVKVSSAMPMQGVLMIREVFEKNPENQLATYYLGMLAIRSGQYGKAIEKFLHLKEINPESKEADFYLGVSYFESGDKAKAKEVFEKLKASTNDPNILQTVNNYLQQLVK